MPKQGSPTRLPSPLTKASHTMSLLEIAVLISGPCTMSLLWAVGHYGTR